MGSRKKHTILIAGASGVVGKAATEHFAAQPDVQVLALSRRPFPLPEGAIHVPLDLTDANACAAASAPWPAPEPAPRGRRRPWCPA